MLIVISDSDFRSGEAAIVNQLFQAGLDLFHIRKYGTSEESLSKLIDGISTEHHSRLVLHHNHEWGKRKGLKRFHYSEKDREAWKLTDWLGATDEWMYSTSVHSVEEYGDLPSHFEYVFLSPVFDSISKPGYKAVSFDLSKKRENFVKLIGLGGIQAGNISQVIQMGFDGAALLGVIWNNPDPIHQLKLCKDAMHCVSNK